MCGRFALYTHLSQIIKIFNLDEAFPFEPSYNIAPSQMISIVCELPDQKRVLSPMRWGLIPSWQKEPKLTSSIINARADTVESKPMFRKAILQRRCLIVADGFYEWQHDGNKQPYFISMKNHEPFGLAGIWERWVGENKTIDSCSIITVEANKLIAPIHNRMPAIIDPKDYNSWLDVNNTKWDEIKKYLKPFKDALLETHPVTQKMNSPRYNKPDCIYPV
jgi:putative SOS response-associated peptidase YedK